MTLKATVVSLRKLPLLIFGLGAFLALQRQHAVIEQDLDVLFLQAGNFGRDPDLLVIVGNLDARPVPAITRRPANGRQAAVESTENFLEQTVDIPVQRQERIALAVAG